MASDSVHPLRIAKTTPNASSSKMSASLPCPLTEISPTERRRNSPSWHQHTPAKKGVVPNNDSSPFQSSPLDSAPSPRLFWQNRNENLRNGECPGPTQVRRSSIESLQKASRVKNSNILALEQKQEYDPTRTPQLERPLAKNPGCSFAQLSGSDSERRFPPGKTSTPVMTSLENPPTLPPSTVPATGNAPSPSKEQVPPPKSSLSPTKLHKGSFDAGTLISTDQTGLDKRQILDSLYWHRHPKSVTFDAAPPQVNEYEMATPDMSSIGTNSREGSYDSVDDDEDDFAQEYFDQDNANAQDDSFDESLEDTDKTPVVGPEDWRGESPMMPYEGDFVQDEGSPLPENLPLSVKADGSAHQRTDSANSDHRPLPPLPGADHEKTQHAKAVPPSPALSATAERLLGGGSHRSLPVPPPAVASKSDIQGFGNGKLTLEERLKLMMLDDDNEEMSPAEQQRERRLRRGTPRERSETESDRVNLAEDEESEADDTVGDLSIFGDYKMPERISRESIMRRVDGNKANEKESVAHMLSPVAKISESVEKNVNALEIFDPDVPLPSTEEEVVIEETYETEGSVIITRSPDSDEEDVMEYQHDVETHVVEVRQAHNTDSGDNDDESQYSDREQDLQKPASPNGEIQAQHARAQSHSPVPTGNPTEQNDTSKSQLEVPASSGVRDELAKTPQDHKDDVPTRTVEESSAPTFERPQTPLSRMSKPEYDGSGWGDPEDDSLEEPGTPESVIHHPMPENEDEDVEEADDRAEDEAGVLEEIEAGKVATAELHVIPERIATIKSSGSRLKTRVSSTPSDLAAMREARRQVSREVPSVPPIPAKHLQQPGQGLEPAHDVVGSGPMHRQSSFQKKSLTLDFDMGLSLDQDFERVIEAQKRGYLMRQNTKVVTASDKDREVVPKNRSANNSPIRQERPQSCIVEPWNSQPRQRSSRQRSGMSGPVPPFPGQESNATALDQVTEEGTDIDAISFDGAERGRLFVKVMGVKDLDLPLPKNERTWFSLTLDNGVHCVTTAWLELARNAPIGQEFELVVPNDLEFQLTLNVRLEKPARSASKAPAPKISKPKTSTFSRVFASPKKRRELEQRQKAEEERIAQQQREELARRNNAPSAYELLSPAVAEDGSFGRSYICLKEHENRCFGRPYMAEVACFNEWAAEDESFVSSVKSKRGTAAVVRRAPYKIGKLELQLLFVPRPQSATDEDMPKSMNSCVRELKAAEERLLRNWEGHLSQQGGDCPYWRRRYFKLAGSKLTAYHEATRQPRATINLANAKRLIDDRQDLTQKETSSRGGRRRRSAFAEEEGYMFVEEGFRIRFNNGEVIDFYADTAEDKEGWMRILSEVIGRGDKHGDEEGKDAHSRAKWCDIVLKREEQLRRQAESRRVHSRTKSATLC